jgi:hypothetical protein
MVRGRVEFAGNFPRDGENDAKVCEESTMCIRQSAHFRFDGIDNKVVIILGTDGVSATAAIELASHPSLLIELMVDSNLEVDGADSSYVSAL